MVPSFPRYPNFRPHFSPMEILEAGAFGGTAYNKISKFARHSEGFRLGLMRIDEEKWASLEYDPQLNKFPGTVATVRRRDMDMPQDIRMLNPDGWFHWYALFFIGRSDKRADFERVNQWRQEVKDLMFYVKKYCFAENKPITDLTVESTLIYRQHLFHFGWDSTIDSSTLIP